MDAFQLAGDWVSRTFLFYNWRLRRRAFPSCALVDVFSSTSVATINSTSTSTRSCSHSFIPALGLKRSCSGGAPSVSA